MNYLPSDQVKKYILLNVYLVYLFCLFDLLNFQKKYLKSELDSPVAICDNESLLQWLGSVICF